MHKYAGETPHVELAGEPPSGQQLPRSLDGHPRTRPCTAMAARCWASGCRPRFGYSVAAGDPEHDEPLCGGRRPAGRITWLREVRIPWRHWTRSTSEALGGMDLSWLTLPWAVRRGRRAVGGPGSLAGVLGIAGVVLIRTGLRAGCNAQPLQTHWAGHVRCCPETGEDACSRKLLARCIDAVPEVTIHMDGKEMAWRWWTDGPG